MLTSFDLFACLRKNFRRPSDQAMFTGDGKSISITMIVERIANNKRRIMFLMNSDACMQSGR